MLSLKWVIKTSDEHITLPLSIARIALGLFFFTSGFNKLFVTANQQLLLVTLTDAGIPFPAVMAVFVAFNRVNNPTANINPPTHSQNATNTAITAGKGMPASVSVTSNSC